jgi:hypothetical protein
MMRMFNLPSYSSFVLYLCLLFVNTILTEQILRGGKISNSSTMQKKSFITQCIQRESKNAQLYLERFNINRKLKYYQYTYFDYLQYYKYNNNTMNHQIHKDMIDILLNEYKNPLKASYIWKKLTKINYTEPSVIEDIKQRIEHFANNNEFSVHNSAMNYDPCINRDLQVNVNRDEFFSVLNSKSNCIEVRQQVYNDFRGVYAKKFISKDTGFFEEKPFVFVSLKENRCFVCDKVIKKKKKVNCGQSNSHPYCGQTLSDLRKSTLSGSLIESPKTMFLIAKLIIQSAKNRTNLFETFPLLSIIEPSSEATVGI